MEHILYIFEINHWSMTQHNTSVLRTIKSTVGHALHMDRMERGNTLFFGMLGTKQSFQTPLLRQILTYTSATTWKKNVNPIVMCSVQELWSGFGSLCLRHSLLHYYGSKKVVLVLIVPHTHNWSLYLVAYWTGWKIWQNKCILQLEWLTCCYFCFIYHLLLSYYHALQSFWQINDLLLFCTTQQRLFSEGYQAADQRKRVPQNIPKQPARNVFLMCLC